MVHMYTYHFICNDIFIFYFLNKYCFLYTFTIL